MQQTLLPLLALSCLLSTALACSSDSDDEPSTPVQKCEALLDSYCDRVVACTADTSDEVTHRECRDATNGYVDCSKSKEITDSYDTCMTDLDNMDCPETSTGFALPSNCNGVILQSTLPVDTNGLGTLIAPGDGENTCAPNGGDNPEVPTNVR